MSKKLLIFIPVLFIIGLVFNSAIKLTPPPSPAAAAEKVFKWRLQSHSSPALTQYKNIEKLCRDIKVMSNGRLDIIPHPGGALVPSADILSSVAKNVIEVGAASCAYHIGVMPENIVTFAPMACRNGDDLHVIWNRLKEFFVKSYAERGVQLLVIKQSDHIPLLSTKKIERITDLKGMKIRTLSALVPFFKELGASAVFIPGGEVYTALSLGTVEAATWGGEGSLYAWKWHEIARQLMWPPLIPASWGEDIFVNAAKWKELPLDLQAIMQTAADMNSFIDRNSLLAEDSAALDLMTKAGVRVVKLPPQDVEVMTKASEKVWLEMAGRSPKAKEYMKVIVGYLREKGYTDFKIE